jgi:4-hydroxybenzoate polyprenyltransferase
MNFARIVHRVDAYEKLMRLDKPIGILLLLWPTLWALWLAVRGVPEWTVLWIFVLGTVLMRSAGCVINDYADRDFDPHVARTRTRPLAARRVSTIEALILAAMLTLIAFALVLKLNRMTILLSIAALFVAATYPFTKRFFALPQAYLGVAFSFGIPMGYAAQLNDVPTPAWVLLAANLFWTIAYDTEYAMVDRVDDERIGIRTAAILFARFDVVAVMLCHAIFLSILAALGWHLQLRWPYYAGLAVAAVLTARQHRLIRDREPGRCFRAFLDNNWVGAVIFAGIALSLLLERGGLR